MRRSVAALLLLVLPVAALAALGPRYGGSLRIGLLDPPVSADPDVPRGFAASLLAGLIREPLLGIDALGQPTPGLASAWSPAAGGWEWTLTLAAGTTFHDGTPITSADAVRSLRRFLRAPSAAGAHLAAALDGGPAFRASQSDDLPGLEAPGPQQIVLRLTRLEAHPLAPLASAAAAVTSTSGAHAGPFVPTLRTPGRWALSAFSGHLRGRPYLDSLDLVAARDSAALRAEREAGRIDAAPGEPGVSALAASVLLVLDPTRSPLEPREARDAVAGALDRAGMVKRFLPGGQPTLSLLPARAVAPPPAERPRARPAISGALPLAVSRDVSPLLSQRIVAELGAIGLEVPVTPESPAAAVAAATPARLLLWTPEVPEPGLALEELASLVFCGPEAAGAIAAVARETNLERRQALLQGADAALREPGTLLPLALAPVSLGLRRGLHGARVDAGGRPLLEDAWVEP